MEDRKIILRELLEKNPADIAEILSDMSEERATELIHRLFLRHSAAQPLGEMDPNESAELVVRLDREEASMILSRMDPDDAVDMLLELPDAIQQELLSRLSRKDAEVLRDLLSYPPDSAGGLMSPEIVPLSLSMTVQEAIDQLRRRVEEAETVYYAYAVDDDGRLLGVLSLRDMALAPSGSTLTDLVVRDAVRVPLDMDVEDVARLFDKYDFFALPVVDDDGRLRGVITVDDVIDVIREEATEDFLKFGGISGGEEYPHTPPRSSIRRRLPWMAANIVLNLVAVSAIAIFEGTIAQVVALAVIMPIISDMGGNVGLQALSVSIRGLAVGKVNINELWQVMRKELAVGLVNGLILGLQLGVIAYLWRGSFYLGLIAAVAMAINTITAGVLGATLPIALKWLKLDPAMMTGAILTTITDFSGFFVFLGLGTLFLERL